MAKQKLCTNCTHNNNGWCNIKKTNKGLRDIIICEFKADSSVSKIEGFLQNKRLEQRITNDSFTDGIVKGLEIALEIMRG